MIVAKDTYDTFPIILDPTDSTHNVAKQSFRIEEAKNYFTNAHDYLTKLKLSFDKKDLAQESNAIYGLLFSKLSF